MVDGLQEWRPGSFTKNFSWGNESSGLRQLYENIRLGFDGELVDTPRELYRERVRKAGRPDFIPINFFLFNFTRGGTSYILADELVFQALRTRHSARFDRLALFALNFSYVGRWLGSKPYQRRPALWAFHYIRDRVAGELGWQTRNVSADDIQRFIDNSEQYVAEGSRKVATNLNYLFRVGGLSAFSQGRVERWWVDSLFLALDRLIEDRKIDGQDTRESEYQDLLRRSDFQAIAGKLSTDKRLAERHLVSLYIACGSRIRFDEIALESFQRLKLPDVQWVLFNDDDVRPKGALHPTNVNVLKSIPRACAMLARYAGFDVITADELENFEPREFVRRRTRDALARLGEQGIEPTMSAEAILRITRDR